MTKTKKPMLKACPFCGADMARVDREESWFLVKCYYPTCFGRTTDWSHEYLAVKAWNRRVKK